MNRLNQGILKDSCFISRFEWDAEIRLNFRIDEFHIHVSDNDSYQHHKQSSIPLNYTHTPPPRLKY